MNKEKERERERERQEIKHTNKRHTKQPNRTQSEERKKKTKLAAVRGTGGRK